MEVIFSPQRPQPRLGLKTSPDWTSRWCFSQKRSFPRILPPPCARGVPHRRHKVHPRWKGFPSMSTRLLSMMMPSQTQQILRLHGSQMRRFVGRVPKGPEIGVRQKLHEKQAACIVRPSTVTTAPSRALPHSAHVVVPADGTQRSHLSRPSTSITAIPSGLLHPEHTKHSI